MANQEKNLEEKIKSVRKQIIALDSRRKVLKDLLGKLENQKAEFTVEQYYQQGKPAGNYATDDKNKDYTSLFQASPVEGGDRILYKLSINNENIQLFMSLFQGRVDVFAKRWENRQGRSGYSPACRNEWIRGICRKPRVRCSNCEYRELIPFTEDIAREHLSGKTTVGVYPLLSDETCNFMVVDFDKEDWQEDVNSFVRTCRDKGIECAVERSRSGKGSHVWFFFESPVSARLARRFGCSLLTETMEHRHQVGLDSYDRFFPNQDTMPQGGFGNLIALPLQAEPAKQGNSLFIDDGFKPYRDQWEYLRSIKRLSKALIETIEAEAARKGRVLEVRMSIDDEMSEKPWLIPPSGRVKIPKITGPLPSSIKLTLSNLLYIEKKDLPPSLINRIIRTAAFQNPEFYRAQAMRLSTFGKPRVISCAEEFEKHIAVPRGYLDEVTALLKSIGVKTDLHDERYKGSRINISFRGKLSDKQEEAVTAILKHDTGVLSAPTAFGKTVVSAFLIGVRKTNTLILVHRKQLLDQWRTRLAAFLDIEPSLIGQWGAGKRKLTAIIDVAMLQSLHRKGAVEDLVAEYGYVIVDECHHLSAFTFENVLRKVKAKYITGLTATPIRKDGHHPIIFMQCGPIRYGQSPRSAALRRGFEHNVVLRYTDTVLSDIFRKDAPKIHDVYKTIIDDRKRTDMIILDVKKALEDGKHPLILTERREHLNALEEQLNGLKGTVVVLHGGVREKRRRDSLKNLADIPEGQPWVILATGRYIGEGFDEPRLDTLFLTMPVSWKGILQQYAGRLHRMHDNKEEVVIYDYVDTNIEMAKHMFGRRKKGYAALGYCIKNPHQLLSD
ncbi:MAG: restriction endonuclease subunit R [Spirochaetes bacterium DG_61]|nr:MAG: restriction endonuclease subunit R [Spirochaetes bacterium DG_61]